MAYQFVLTNDSDETVVAKLYDWNDKSWGIAYKTYEISGNGGQKRLSAADNPVMQIGLYQADGKTPCPPLDQPFMNYYSTSRAWTVVHKNGYWNIVKTNPEI